MAGNWTFHPFVSSSPSLIPRFLLIFLLIQLKPKHHRVDVLTIFQRGARGVCSACGAVLRDTDKNFLALQIVSLLVIAIAILLLDANIPGDVLN